MANIFREQALERLSSPEQLDQAMRVARPTGWLALGFLVLVSLGALLWATVSTAPITVRGEGILIKRGGLVDVVSATSGRVVELTVDVGARVAKGALIARVAQPDLQEKIASAQKALRDLEDQKAQVLDLQARDRVSRRGLADHQRANLQQSIVFGEQQLGALEDRLAAQKDLWAKRFIAKQSVADTEVQVTTVKEQLAKTKADIEAIDLDVRTREDQNQHELMSLDLQIGAAARTLNELQASMAESGQVRATATGIVAETKVSVGDVVSPGVALLTLVPDQGEGAPQTLVAQVFIAAADGKKVRPDMAAQVAPSTVKREEYGAIVGKVRSVADIPATAEGMLRVLKNRQLVEELSKSGAPIQIEVDLDRADTPSGFRWSSSGGPDLAIDQGTLVSAFVTVRRVRLITMLLPMLEPLLGSVTPEPR